PSIFFSLQSHLHPPHLHSFPTRRSSDLHRREHRRLLRGTLRRDVRPCEPLRPRCASSGRQRPDALRTSGTWSPRRAPADRGQPRSEEHTSELQSLAYLVCRLLLEKKKQT